MAFENVTLRTATGETYGPVTMQELLQWHRDGRVPPNSTLVDTVTGEERPAANFPMLAVAPPPMPGAGYAMPQQPSAPSGLDHMIPTKNPFSLWAYYGGIMSLLFCFLGPVVIYLGIRGLKDVPRVGVGRTHSIVGIILGSITSLGMLGVGAAIIASIASSSH